jgi:hypothetical protein
VGHLPHGVRVAEHHLADRRGVIACADSSTICARRHVTIDPDVRSTIRKSR